MIQLNRLEGFYWVAKTGGYAKAARAFPYPITQPAVHQQVKKLETEVGIALFERVGKDRILLTPAGRQLYAFVEPFFGDLAALLRALRAGTPEGELKVHAQSLFLRELLPAWLRRIQKRSPGVRIDLHELGDDAHAPLRSGVADLVVTYIPDESPGIDKRTVAMLHPFVVLPEDHPLATRKRPQVARLADETFVAYAHGTIAQRLQLEELARHGVHPSRVVTATTADTILSLVEAGMGYSLVPWLSADGPRRRGVVARPLAGKRHHYPVHAAWRNSAAENPLLQAALAAAPQP